jgi:lipid-binding SYLF domain-containing protein
MYKQLERYREEKGRVRMAKYTRCSSDEQKKNGYTIKDQSDFIELFAKENELIVVGEYVDEGFVMGIESGSGLVKSAVDRAFSFENPASFRTSQAGYANAGGNYNMLVAAFTEALKNVDLNINYNQREFARVIAAAGG